MIDLHVHSIFSDGTETPEVLIELAAAAGVKALALTDHDTVKGLPRFFRAAEARGVRAVAGVEVSSTSDFGDMHILGYLMDYEDVTLAEQLEWIRSARRLRNEEILHNLHRLGMPLRWSEVEAFAGDEVIGRPHFAQALVARGYVPTTRMAFNRYLARGCPAYAKRRTLTVGEAIEIIRGAGGVAVLAHPFALDCNWEELATVLARLRDMGLDGVETYYPQHTPQQVKRYLKLAGQFNLVPTGGSDYHGAVTPDLRIGRGFGTLAVPDDVMDRLMARCA